MDISIVIPTKNGAETISDLLEAIAVQETERTYETIVIDSGSEDGTTEIVKSFENVRLTEISPEEFNHGLTRNKGVQMSRGELAVLVTQDALPSGPNWLKNLVEPFEDEKVAGVYCRQIPRADASITVKQHLNAWLTGRKKRDVKEITDRDAYKALNPAEKHRFCTFDNVCSCIRKSVWETIPFRETDFAEDLIWGKEVLEAGWKIVYQPDASVIHSHDRSLLWEYSREYICHYKLFRLFGLMCVPSLTKVLITFPFVALSDMERIVNLEPNWFKKFTHSVRAPFSAFMRLLGQYRGAKKAVREQK